MMHYSAEHSLSGGSFYLFFLFCAVLVNSPFSRFTRTTFSISLWWRVNVCVSMFFCVLRAVKGEHGEVGKSLRIKWLLVTVISWLFFLQCLDLHIHIARTGLDGSI